LLSSPRSRRPTISRSAAGVSAVYLAGAAAVTLAAVVAMVLLVNPPRPAA
jgi:hypothetical protein